MNTNDLFSRLSLKRILAIAIGLILGQYVSTVYAWFKSTVGPEIAWTVLGVLVFAGLIVGINTWWKWWLNQPNTTPPADATAQ
jgi:hypothetical protein